MQPPPNYVSVGHTFIDDIVYPSGKTCMEVLGGGGVHAASGILVWDEQPGLIAGAGSDIPANARRRLQADFDTRGILWADAPQMRAWQIFENDNRRAEVLRVTPQPPFLRDPDPSMCPEAYLGAQAFTILNYGDGFQKWRALLPNTLLMWEPNQSYMVADNRDEFIQTLPYADIVSPNLLEAQMLYDIDHAEDLVRRMLADGARIVALRMGELGSLVGQQGRASLLHVPAVPVARIEDQTGSGNAYCGGFIVGWVRTGSLCEASCHAAVSASFALEHLGPIKIDERTPSVRQKRYEWLKQRVEAEPVRS